MNKNGWGLRAELAFLLLFLICILIATIGLHRMGLLGNNDSGVYEDFSSYSSGSSSFDYDSLEKQVETAAKRYYNDKYSTGDTIVVSVDTLKTYGYLMPIYDSRSKECKGYAKILRTGNAIAYIKCSNYKTVGYSEEYE